MRISDWSSDVCSSDLDYAYFYDALYGSAVYLYDNAGDQISPNQYIDGIDRYRRNFFEARVASPADARIRFIGGFFWKRQKHNTEIGRATCRDKVCPAV